MSSEIEKSTDLWKVLEEQILDNEMEFTFREVLGIAKKEFHDMIIDLVKTKWLSTEPENPKSVDVSMVAIDKVAGEEECSDNHHMRLH